MNPTETRNKIARILGDDGMDRAAKIDRLHGLEEDVRALERAATEGPMIGDDNTDALATSLRLIEDALDGLGGEPADPGAASL